MLAPPWMVVLYSLEASLQALKMFFMMSCSAAGAQTSAQASSRGVGMIAAATCDT